MYQVELKDDGKVELSQSDNKLNFSKTIYASVANMPDDIRTKLSALKMVTPPDGYKDIGQRVNETLFWIFE